jgi:integrase/recombinase XerD
LWSDTDVCRLLEAYRRLQPALQAATHETLFGLLSASGMRLGEVIGLSRDDVDLATGVLTIREAKFGRSRLVPLHPSVTKKLGSYVVCRDQLCPTPKSPRFFVSSEGRALTPDSVRTVFIRLTTELGLRTVASKPRLHDLRHSFAVHTSSNGTAPAPIAKARWRPYPPILGTSTRLSRIGISQPHPS